MVEVNRRLLGKMLAGGMLGGSLLGPSALALAQEPKPTHVHPKPPANAPTISILVYSGMVLLDLAGPLSVFTIMGSLIQLIGKNLQPVTTDCGISVSPTHDLTTARKAADVFLIPGGTIGTIECMNDPAILDFVRAQGDAAKYVTSVCTGSLVLAAAGLLRGYRATSLWAVADLLPLMGAQHVDERVVVDRNRITAGGVTAGIDFGLMLAAKLTDERTAKRVQLTLEYAPQPPFHAGTPQDAGPELLAYTRGRRKGMDAAAANAARVAGKRLRV
ncbi:DJ-1/PfpI family protein [Sphingomonas sp. So64.6b]|nr:DJ-1/PfpI family protein [Sphingomonas sp. So64.6b]